MENVTGVLIMILLGILQVLVLIILSDLILINNKKTFLGLGEEPLDGINDSTGTPGKEIALTLVIKKNFAKVYITMVMRVTCK